MNLQLILIAGAGGFLGTVARYLSVQWIDSRFNSVFPFGTLAVNVFGALLLGFLMGAYSRGSSPAMKLFFTTGFCGGFTTFSAFAFENFNLINERFVQHAVIYTTLSVVLTVALTGAGFMLGRTVA